MHFSLSNCLVTLKKIFFHLSMEAASQTPKKSLSLPLRTRLYLAYMSAATDVVSRPNGTVIRRLHKLVQNRIPPIPIPIDGVKTYDVIMDPSRKLWFRVFVPTEHAIDEDLPVIVFFHGGGFVYLAPNVRVYDTLCRQFAKSMPAVVVSLDYRLAPEHPYPAQHNDCFDVLKFLDDGSQWLPVNADISRCFLVGDSAGGNLAHHVAQRASEFNFQRLKVIGVVAIQPYFGGEERTNSEIEHEGLPLVAMKQRDWFWKALMPPSEGYNRDHPIINVAGPNAIKISNINFPATIVIVSGFDPMQDRHKRYYEWLKNSGKEAYLVEYPNTFHGFYAFPYLPESEQLLSDVQEFVHKVCSDANCEY